MNENRFNHKLVSELPNLSALNTELNLPHFENERDVTSYFMF